LRNWFSGQPVYRQVALGVAVYFLIALLAYAAFGGNACAVMVNGNMVAVAADKKSAESAVDELVRLKSGRAGMDLTVMEEVSFDRVRVEPEQILGRAALKEKLANQLTFKAKGTAILVNGKPKVFLKNGEEAHKLLAWLKTLYPANEDGQVGFKENIGVEEIFTPVGNILEMEAAKKLVLTGQHKVQQYTVKEGDTLWDIARAVNIGTDQIVLSNPSLDPDRLSIGQVLNLSREAPLITVTATRQVTLKEEIPCPVEVKRDKGLLMGEEMVVRKGVPGERVVTYRITTENGLETEREVLEQEVIREPSTQVVARGYLTLASRSGVARLEKPCAGGIVSGFGMRDGRMHEGVDFAAGYGSSVVAAAGGTVNFVGWRGGYGKIVEIRHQGGLVTRYAHLSSINVHSGQQVKRGQLIGRVGATGYTTGPHLHFEVRIDGRPLNPVNYLP